MPIFLARCRAKAPRSRKELTNAQRQSVVGMRAVGGKVKDIAKYFRVHVNTISRIHSRHKQEGTVLKKPRSGRPPKLTDRDLRCLKRLLYSDRTLGRKQLTKIMCENTNKNFSKWVIREALKKLVYAS